MTLHLSGTILLTSDKLCTLKLMVDQIKDEDIIYWQFRVELGDITPHNIKKLRKLNSAVFHITYTDKLYKDVLEFGELAKFAYFNDIVVGGVCCQVETEAMVKRLSIMTLGCLAAYHRLGVG
ncbi:N-alpha-acetyltransferase 50-like isoform X2 [Dysidea avara]|uniref:N-alpha-acetyltransferase 50-like isoform X2 n=1 Tax=Dysidea avara TaxID=196820 RepID=UPI003333400F